MSTVHENISDTVQHIRDINKYVSQQLSILEQFIVWRTLHYNELYPYCKQPKNLQPEDHPLCLEFCDWLNRKQQLDRFILITDKAQFNQDGICLLYTSRCV